MAQIHTNSTLASERNSKTSICFQFPASFSMRHAALQQWTHFETLMAQLILRAGLCQTPLATCRLTSSRSLSMAAGIYPGPSCTGNLCRWGTFVIYVYILSLFIKGLSRRSMRHQEGIDERLTKGRNTDWHVFSENHQRPPKRKLQIWQS